MKIFNNATIPEKFRSAAIAIGNFDGIHKGHQKIFQQANKYARKNKIKFGIMTFTPLPVMFFKKNIKNFRLVSEDQKFQLLQKYAIDFVINIKFNKMFSKITAEKFIENIIFQRINPRIIFVSKNFRFGNKRKGNVSLLKSFGKKYNYKLVNTKAFMYKKK